MCRLLSKCADSKHDRCSFAFSAGSSSTQGNIRWTGPLGDIPCTDSHHDAVAQVAARCVAHSCHPPLPGALTAYLSIARHLPFTRAYHRAQGCRFCGYANIVVTRGSLRAHESRADPPITLKQLLDIQVVSMGKSKVLPDHRRDRPLAPQSRGVTKRQQRREKHAGKEDEDLGVVGKKKEKFYTVLVGANPAIFTSHSSYTSARQAHPDARTYSSVHQRKVKYTIERYKNSLQKQVRSFPCELLDRQCTAVARLFQTYFTRGLNFHMKVRRIASSNIHRRSFQCCS